MPASTTCHNCMRMKDPSEYGNYYCSACETAKSEAREYATREGLDVGSVVRKALAARVGSAMEKNDPRAIFDRVDLTAMGDRMAIEPGAFNDPRRAPLR